MPDPESRICPKCKVEFSTNRSWQKFCNKDCQVRFWQDIYTEARKLVIKAKING